MEYVALYEDFKKVEALTDDEESYHDLAQSPQGRTAKRFDTLDAAVAWASKVVDDALTVYGCAEVREIAPVERRCRYCICGGRQLVRRHIVSEAGIDETEEAESECHD